MSDQIVDMLEAVQRPQVARLQARVIELESENARLRAIIETAIPFMEDDWRGVTPDSWNGSGWIDRARAALAYVPATAGGSAEQSGSWKTCRCQSWAYDPVTHGPDPRKPNGHHPWCTDDT